MGEDRILSQRCDNAKRLNHPGELGVLAPEVLADMIVVDGNPLDGLHLLQEQGTHLALLMKGGQIDQNTLN